MRLAGTIRWFYGNSDHDPPYDSIVSTFKACFNSARQLYPSMRDRAYFSARAILQINAQARLQSRERASLYPIPVVRPLDSCRHADPDLHHIICLLEQNFRCDRLIFDFPNANTNSLTHSLWMSELFVDFARAGPNPTLKSFRSYITAAVTNHRAMIANVLLVWYLFLGGRIEEETFWAMDKSYVVIILSLNPPKFARARDSLETILFHLSTRVMDVIARGIHPRHLTYLVEFLVAWEKRPACLAHLVYQWCSAVFEAIEELKNTPETIEQAARIGSPLRPASLLRDRSDSYLDVEFSEVGPGCDLFRPDDTFHHARGIALDHYKTLLSITLELGFRRVTPLRDWSDHYLDHTPHHDRMLEFAFSEYDDEVIADAVTVWTVDGDHALLGSFPNYLSKRMEWDQPFSPRLRRVSICAIERSWRSVLGMSESETVDLLNRLDADMDDMVEIREWIYLLKGVIRSSTGWWELSAHYWCLLDKLASAGYYPGGFESRDVEVMRLLKEVKDWEKLEVWVAIMWRSLDVPRSKDDPNPREDDELMEEICQTTLRLLLRRPSTLPKFESLCKECSTLSYESAAREIFEQARKEQSPLEPPPP